jgi:hypothetical protein
MSSFLRQFLFAVALAAAAIDPAFATTLLVNPQLEETSDDEVPYRCWWMPDSAPSCDKCSALDLFLTPDAEPRNVPSQPGSLFEEAVQRLQTPRPKLVATNCFIGYQYPDPDNSPVPVWPDRNQFSHTWSDGAPLLLYDWSGKSADRSAAPNLRQDGLQRVAGVTGATDFGDLTAKVKLRERDAQLDPSVRNAWETDQSVKVPVAGSVFVFNQVTGSTPDVDQHQYKVLGKTGVGLKVKPWLLQEVQFRTGPAVRYDDTTTLSKGQSPERSELFVEAVTKVPVPVVGPVNIEYSSYAVPAATPSDHNQINQDVKFALPFNGGQFHVGAKYKWESATATPWMDRMQVYLGVQNKW